MVFGPWFCNSDFGISILEASKYLILYFKHSIKCNERNKENGEALKLVFPSGFQGNLCVLCVNAIVYFYVLLKNRFALLHLKLTIALSKITYPST